VAGVDVRTVVTVVVAPHDVEAGAERAIGGLEGGGLLGEARRRQIALGDDGGRVEGGGLGDGGGGPGVGGRLGPAPPAAGGAERGAGAASGKWASFTGAMRASRAPGGRARVRASNPSTVTPVSGRSST